MLPRHAAFALWAAALFVAAPAGAVSESCTTWIRDARVTERLFHEARASLRPEVDETAAHVLSELAPEAIWNTTHPAWPAALDAVREALHAQSKEPIGWVLTRIERIVEAACEAIDPAELRVAGGAAADVARLRDAAAGMPFDWAFEAPPDAATEAGAARSPRLREAEQALVREIAFELDVKLGSILAERSDAILAAARRAVAPFLPVVDAGRYVGRLTLQDDGAVEVLVDIRGWFRLNGQIPLRFEAGDRHAAELLAQLPGLRPGEHHYLFRDAAGRLESWAP